MSDLLFTPRSILEAHPWDSALWTTYSLSLSFLEAIPLAGIAKSYREFTVITDVAGYQASVSDVGAIGIGRDYDVVPVKFATGVFHPKIGVLTAKDGEVRATVGSGNLTFGGWGFNNEVLEVLRPGRDSKCFEGISEFLEAIQREARPGNRLECHRPPTLYNFIEQTRKASRVPGQGTASFLHTLSGPLYPQIAALTDELGGAEEFTVVSPFFSTHSAVRKLATELSCEKVQVAVPPRAPQVFDFGAAAADGFSVQAVDCDHFRDSRSLHAKVLDITCRNGRLLVSGSANATTQALGGTNVEAVVARIYDLAPLFGWVPANANQCAATGESPPSETARSTLVVEYTAGLIRGRLLGAPADTDTFAVTLAWGTTRLSVDDEVQLDDGKTFSFVPPPTFDPVSIGSSIQVILMRGETEIRGWLIVRGVIDAINRRGSVARTFMRILSKGETDNDVAHFLEYLATNPEELFAAAGRTGGGRKKTKGEPSAPLTGPFEVKDSFEIDDPSDHSDGKSGEGDELIDALVRMLATQRPRPEEDTNAAEEEETEEPNGNRKSPRSGRSGTPSTRNDNNKNRTVQPLLTMAFKRLFKELQTFPKDSSRVDALLTVFDLIAKFATRIDEGANVPHLLKRWLDEAFGCRPTTGDTFDIDRCISVAVTRLAIGDPARSTEMHSYLQRWVGGELDEDFIYLSQPEASESNEQFLLPEQTQEDLSDAWKNIVSTVTPWQKMSALERAFKKGEPFETPEGTKLTYRKLLEQCAADPSKANKIVWARKPVNSNCPRCGIRFPGLSVTEYQRHRITSCDSFLCGRLIVNVCP